MPLQLIKTSDSPVRFELQWRGTEGSPFETVLSDIHLMGISPGEGKYQIVAKLLPHQTSIQLDSGNIRYFGFSSETANGVEQILSSGNQAAFLHIMEGATFDSPEGSSYFLRRCLEEQHDKIDSFIRFAKGESVPGVIKTVHDLISEAQEKFSKQYRKTCGGDEITDIIFLMISASMTSAEANAIDMQRLEKINSLLPMGIYQIHFLRCFSAVSLLQTLPPPLPPPLLLQQSSLELSQEDLESCRRFFLCSLGNGEVQETSLIPLIERRCLNQAACTEFSTQLTHYVQQIFPQDASPSDQSIPRLENPTEVFHDLNMDPEDGSNPDRKQCTLDALDRACHSPASLEAAIYYKSQQLLPEIFRQRAIHGKFATFGIEYKMKLEEEHYRFQQIQKQMGSAIPLIQVCRNLFQLFGLYHLVEIEAMGGRELGSFSFRLEDGRIQVAFLNDLFFALDRLLRENTEDPVFLEELRAYRETIHNLRYVFAKKILLTDDTLRSKRDAFGKVKDTVVMAYLKSQKKQERVDRFSALLAGQVEPVRNIHELLADSKNLNPIILLRRLEAFFVSVNPRFVRASLRVSKVSLRKDIQVLNDLMNAMDSLGQTSMARFKVTLTMYRDVCVEVYANGNVKTKQKILQKTDRKRQAVMKKTLQWNVDVQPVLMHIRACGDPSAENQMEALSLSGIENESVFRGMLLQYRQEARCRAANYQRKFWGVRQRVNQAEEDFESRGILEEEQPLAEEPVTEARRALIEHTRKQKKVFGYSSRLNDVLFLDTKVFGATTQEFVDSVRQFLDIKMSGDLSFALLSAQAYSDKFKTSFWHGKLLQELANAMSGEEISLILDSQDVKKWGKPPKLYQKCIKALVKIQEANRLANAAGIMHQEVAKTDSTVQIIDAFKKRVGEMPVKGEQKSDTRKSLEGTSEGRRFLREIERDNQRDRELARLRQRKIDIEARKAEISIQPGPLDWMLIAMTKSRARELSRLNEEQALVERAIKKLESLRDKSAKTIEREATPYIAKALRP
ncbi:MAG: hypothetical protein A2103_03065 [Gammaproteobacteria bacterium GWF2_41_13]|nr:MAG: hypothetical protein A2103_03065 [Gammaproteobacteria bacterium GWF2_41_13]